MVSELRERAQVLPQVQVAGQQEPMQQVSVGAATTDAELRRREVLSAFANLPAEAEVDFRIVAERDVLDRVPQVRPARGIAEVAIILLVAKRFVSGRASAG